MSENKINSRHIDTASKSSIPLTWYLCIAAVAFGCYVNTLGHQWAYDDMYITENTYITEAGHVRDIFTTTYHYGREQIHSALWRPLTIFSYLANKVLFGIEPWSFHLVNVLLHTVCSVLVLVLAWQYGRNIALIASLFFASHPVHTEAVANVFGRSELLSFVFGIAAYILWRRRNKNKWFYPLSLLAFFTGILCKETIAVIPVIMVMVLAGERLRGENINTFRKGSAETGAYFLIILFYLLLRGLVMLKWGDPPPIHPYANPLAGLSFFERFPTALGIITRYAVLLLFPLKLSGDYSYNQIPLIGFFHPMSLAGLAIVVLTTAGLILTVRRTKTVYEGLLFLALPFTVFSNILFTIGTIMGERLLYLPSLGFSILAAKGLAFILRKRRDALWAAVILITVAYSARSLVRNPVWENDDNFYSRTAETSPMSAPMAYNWGVNLYDMGRHQEAMEEWKRTLRIDPHNSKAWKNLGAALVKAGRYEEAIELYRKATPFSEQQKFEYIGETYIMMGNKSAAIEAYRTSFDLDPANMEIAVKLGMLLAEEGRYEEAINIHIGQSLRNPRDYRPWVNMAHIHMVQGDWENEEKCLHEAINTSPMDPFPHNLLLSRLASRGLRAKAVAQLEDMSRKGIPVDTKLLNQVGPMLKQMVR